MFNNFKGGIVMQNFFWLVPAISAVALLFAWFFRKQMIGKEEGTPRMIEIANAIREGAKSYLKVQDRVVAIFLVVMAVLFAILAFGLGVQSKWIPLVFLVGGFLSGLSGFLGMETATRASVRVTNAARNSLGDALSIAFRSGSVMGLSVVGLSLLGISIFFAIFYFGLGLPLEEVTSILFGFGIGASFVALFARVGGGIYTKAADVGADLVGKVEAGIPEDDPRNPATIADNVGDNVGDVAGMGADLYESYSDAIIATMALGVAAGLGMGGVLEPLLIAAVGVLFSILGVFFVRAGKEATQHSLIKSLSRGINFTMVATGIVSVFVVWFLTPDNLGVIGSVLVGLVSGTIIGKTTEFYTSSAFSPVRRLADSATSGPATLVIDGLALGLSSTTIPVITVSLSILLAFFFAGGFNSFILGLYGVGLAAVGMLATLGITLASDAYGPIADNAGGIAEMSGLGKEVRARTDQLDALGNTTAATGKGFAIGSAAFTGLALIAAYLTEIKIALTRLGVEFIHVGEQIISVSSVTFLQLADYYNLSLLNPTLLASLLIGTVIVFLFCGLTMSAVGRTAQAVIGEVREQFKDPAILKGKKKPAYARTVAIVTRAAQKRMIIPSMIAIIAPVLIGVFFGVSGVVGFLVGALASGFAMAVFMANAGGAFDNAKKFIEEGAHGGKGSDAHKAAVAGDTVGDPMKDTSGPSLNILIKLMSILAVITAGFIVKLFLK
jgi:K(+)-stimulated pyrophosphate-energized sodium pump